METQENQVCTIAILLATYNGKTFLPAQLDSIESQHHQNWFLVVSDDGSTDDTLAILIEYQARWPRNKMIIRIGPREGFCKNFLSMACDVTIKADYYAFCDQDDVWLPTKLTIAIDKIHDNQNNNFPYLYCGRTTYVNEKLKKLGYSPLFSFPRAFRNALIQSIAGGNTMVFNQKTKVLLEKAGIVDHPSHDWWLYQLVTGAGGDVFYDPIPQVLYRQHRGALVGGTNSVSAKLERISMVFKGQFRRWSDQNIDVLTSSDFLLTNASKETLMLFKKIRDANLKDRLRLLEVAGLYRQTWRGTISLLIAALLKKI